MRRRNLPEVRRCDGGALTVVWRKASCCASGERIEAASWRKSARSGYNGNCVESGHGPGVVGVRDSKLGDASPVLEFPAEAWRAFTAKLKG